MQVLVALPSHYGMVHSGSLRAGMIWASEQHEIQIAMPASSLLPKTFNLAWCAALKQASAGKIDAFAMLHDDIVPDPGWLDVLIDEMESTGADVVSAVVPIKDDRGITSTAIAAEDPSDIWHIERRLTMHEVFDLPETFTAADCGYPDRALLMNTGCWVARLPDERYLKTTDGVLDFSFSIHSRVVMDGEDFQIQLRSEDWEFGRWLWREGFDVRATRKVELQHFATTGYPNNRPWGTVKTEAKDASANANAMAGVTA